MSEFSWTMIRETAVTAFRDAPNAGQEQRVVDVFREHPALVVEAIEHVAQRFASGQVRNPWAILAKHVEEAVRPLEDVTVSDTRDREKRIGRAEQWMRASGKHLDRESEVLDELFDGLGGDRSEALLKPWREEQALRARMVAFWRELSPEGVLIERQASGRAEHWKATTGLRWKLERDPKFRARWLAEQRQGKSPDGWVRELIAQEDAQKAAQAAEEADDLDTPREDDLVLTPAEVQTDISPVESAP